MRSPGFSTRTSCSASRLGCWIMPTRMTRFISPASPALPIRSSSRVRPSSCKPVAPTSPRCSWCSIHSTSVKAPTDATPLSWPSCAEHGPGNKETGNKDVSEKDRLRLLDLQVTVSGSSPIPGLGVAGGFKFIVEDKGGLGLSTLQSQTEKLVHELKQVQGLDSVSHPVPLQHAATLSRHRPDQGSDVGSVAQRSESDAGHVSWLALRQQLQRLRPALAGQPSSRKGSSAPRPRTSACSRFATRRAKWSPSAHSCGRARSAARSP